MSRGFVDVPADVLREALMEMGFDRNPAVRGREEVYDVRKGPAVIRCYTSITVGDDGARGCGQDAIRVVAFDVDSNRGLYKGKRVHRTGSVAAVVARVRERVADAIRVVAMVTKEETYDGEERSGGDAGEEVGPRGRRAD